jgi:hypothetical protein
MDRVLLRQILLTLAYSAGFDHPLKIEELRSRLYVPRQGRQNLDEFWWLSQDKQLSLINNGLALMLSWGWVVNRGEWWTLSTHSSDLVRAVAGRKLANLKLKKAKQVVRAFGWWPWIKSVYISGSVAAGLSGADDDLDFLIVTWPGCLWITRPLVVFLAWIFGHRRSWSKEEPNSWCFNLWLESDDLAMSPDSHSLYTAFELVQLKQVWGRDNTSLIWSQNPWLYNYLPLFDNQLIHSRSQTTIGSGWLVGKLVSGVRYLGAVLGYPLVLLVNIPAYFIQLGYMRPHMTKEKVGYNKAFFHPRNTRCQIYANWRREVVECVRYKDD